MRVTLERTDFKQLRVEQVKPRWQLDPDLVLYLPFWNLNGDVFLSQDAYGHTVTRYGATPTGQGGWSFDGTDDYLTCGSTLQLDFPTQDFSYMAWVKLTSVTGIARWILKGQANDNGWTLYSDGAALVFNIHNGGAVRSTTTGSILSTDVWMQIVFVRNNSVGKIYQDGKDVTSASDSASGQAATTLTTYIGIESNGSSYPFSGYMGEVALYNRALTEREILNLYNESKGRYGGG